MENIFPVEIEDFLMENEKIQDAAAIGIPDKRLVEAVAAVIKAKPGKEMTEHKRSSNIVRPCRSTNGLKRSSSMMFHEIPRVRLRNRS